MSVQGKIFKSPFAGFRAQVRSEAVMYHPNTGVEINRVKPLTAEFGIFGEEFDFELEDGTTHKSANIMGGYFDSAEAAERLGWSDDEHDSVVSELERWSIRWPEAVQVISKAAAALPWPTYDATDAAKVAELAEALGFIAEALAYEPENKNRKTVVAKLEEALARQAATPAAEELTVA